jgi:hypothetical protein
MLSFGPAGSQDKPGGQDRSQPPGTKFNQRRFTTRLAKPFSPGTTFKGESAEQFHALPRTNSSSRGRLGT